MSTDGRWLATTGGDDVRVFDMQARRQAVTIRGPRIRSLAFDPTGPRLLTGAATGDVAIWLVPSGARVRHLRDVRDPVDAVAFSPDGRLATAGSLNGEIQIWRTESGELQNQLASRHSKILAVEFDRASRLVLAAGADGTVVVADAALGTPVFILEGPQNIVMVAHFDPSSRRVVGASLEGNAWVWDATSPYRRWGLPPVADDCGLGPSPEADRCFIAVGCRNRATSIWDTARDQLVAELPSATPVGGNFLSASPTVSSAGDRAAIARGDEAGIYELPGGRLLRSIAHEAPVSAVAFAATGRDVVSGLAARGLAGPPPREHCSGGRAGRRRAARAGGRRPSSSTGSARPHPPRPHQGHMVARRRRMCSTNRTAWQDQCRARHRFRQMAIRGCDGHERRREAGRARPWSARSSGAARRAVMSRMHRTSRLAISMGHQNHRQKWSPGIALVPSMQLRASEYSALAAWPRRSFTVWNFHPLGHRAGLVGAQRTGGWNGLIAAKNGSIWIAVGGNIRQALSATTSGSTEHTVRAEQP